MSRIDGKVALISGAGRGIGAQTARTLAEAGGTVVLTDVDLPAVEKRAQELREGGFAASAYPLDVTREDDWKDVMAQVCRSLGGLDVLVNNAGIECIRRIADLTLEEWHGVCRVNLDGVFLGTKHAIWAMVEGSSSRPKGGSIVNLSSVAGIVGSAGQSAYNMTKGGVRLFTKSAALELARLQIRVNSVHPGVVQTPMVDAAWQPWTDVGYGGSLEQTRRSMLALHPIGRLGEPIDIARAILYLASDDASFVTGSELVVDGGLTAR